MILHHNVIGEILFSWSLLSIRQKLELLRKDKFDALDKIIIYQDIVDEYPYVDAIGSKLIEIQKIINQVDISNCFIKLITANKDISREIEFVTRFYSIDDNPIEYHVIEGVYEKIVKKYNDTACRKLWNHLYVGTDGNINPCCLADHRFPLGNISDIGVNNTIEKNAGKIRSDMLQGYRTRACAACYDREDRGIDSARIGCNPIDQPIHIEHLDIRLNNICNFKCRMCSEYSSSAIQQETIELYGKDVVLGYEKISLDRLSNSHRYQMLEKILPFVTCDIKGIYFAGGEPMIMGEHYEILEQLIKIQNTDLSIRYNSNLSTLRYKQYDVIDKWRQFSNVTVAASIDASGDVAEYMRHGTVWSDIESNIHVIKETVPHVKLRIASTVSCLTIENLINLQNNWIDQKLFCEDDFVINVLTAPNFLSPAVLPLHHKQRLTNIIQKHIRRFFGTKLADGWNNVLQWMNNNDYTFALKDFVHRTRVLDSHRGESFEKIFPEYKDLLS